MAAHYAAFGRHEHRVPQRLRVVASYEAAAGDGAGVGLGGLGKQLYSHVGMLSVAVQMGAEVVRLCRAGTRPRPSPRSRSRPATDVGSGLFWSQQLFLMTRMLPTVVCLAGCSV